MILLKSIKLKNFLSHEDTVLELDDSTKLLIDGQSGSGKTSICEALIWALYGVGRSDNRNLVRNGSKNASVEVVLQEGGTYFKINRGTTDKAKNTLSILSTDDILADDPKWEPIKRNGSRDIQDWIEKELLKASYTLFTNSVVYPQDNPNSFVRQTASKRKDLLLEVANIGDFDLYYSRAKEALQLETEKLIRLQSEVAVHSKNLASTKVVSDEEIEEIREKIEEYTNSIEGKKMELEAFKINVRRSTEIAREVQREQDSKDRIQNEIYKLEASAKDKREEVFTVKFTETVNIPKIEEELADLGKLVDFDALEARILKDYERSMKMNALLADRPVERDYASEIKELEDRLSPLLKDSHACPAGDGCPFVIPIKNQIKYLQDKIAEKQEKLKELEKAVSEYQKKIKDIGISDITPEDKKRHQEFKKLKEVKTEKEKILASLRAKVEKKGILERELASFESEIDTKKRDMLEFSSKIEKLKLEQGIYSGAIVEIEKIEYRINIETKERENLLLTVREYETTKKRIKEFEDNIAILNKEIAIVNSDIKKLTAVKEAFGSRGLKTIVIDYLIPTLEERINNILGRLSDFRVRLDTQRESADGSSTVEGLYINITNGQGEEFGYDNFSGGEKVKITMAISEALATLQKCGFRVLDEAIVALDRESTEALIDVLNKIMQKFDQMICISHLAEIKDRFEDKVEIKKVNGTSVVQK